MTTDKETLEQLSRIRLVVAEENRSTYDCYYAVKSALTIIDSLTTQLADRAAQIVRQGEMLERAADALELAKEWISEYRSQDSNVIPSVSDILDMEKIDDALAALQINGNGKDTGSGGEQA